MEDLILKCAEFGILGVVVLVMLTKGLTNLNELTKTTAMLSESQKALAESISKLTEKVSNMGTQLNAVTFRIEGIEKRLDKIEENANRNFAELRDLITGNPRGKAVIT